ncbi:MAG: autotransporter outer membrane beta-barrel domain-containing protein [Fusobacteriaceae bacterium]
MLRKKIFILFFITIGTISWGIDYQGNNITELNSNFIAEKGKQYMRQGIISDYLNRAGASKSTQNIEVFLGEGKADRTSEYSSYRNKNKGFIIGTTSEFNATEEGSFITGVTLGYINSKINYNDFVNDEKIRTLGANSYIGYLRNNYFTMATLGLGMSIAKNGTENYDRNNVNVGIEGGRFFNVFSRNYLYPYLGFGYGQYFQKGYKNEKNMKYEKNNYDILNIGTGLSYYADFTKFIFKSDLRWTKILNVIEERKISDYSENTIQIDNSQANNEQLTLASELGYYIAEDLLVSLEVTGVYAVDYRDIIFGVKIGYTF